MQDSMQSAEKSQNQYATETKNANGKLSLLKRKFPTWGDLLAVIGVFVLTNIAAGVIVWLISRFNGLNMNDSLPSEWSWLVALVQIITFVPLIIFVMYQRYSVGLPWFGLRLATNHMNSPMILWGVLFVLVSGVVIEPLLNILPDTGMDNLDNLLGSGGWSIFAAVIIAPVLEELLFRGLFIDSARRRIGTFWAVFVSAFLFGLAHGIPQQAFNAFVVGLILGYIYIRTNSLAAVMIIHAINNALSYVLMELFGSSNVMIKDIISNNTVYYTVYVICLIVFVLAMVKLVITLRNNDEINVSDNKQIS